MLSLLLLIGAGLFVQTLRNLRSQDLGLDREHVLLVWTAIRQSNRQIGAQVGALFETAQQHVSSLPGVVSASVSVRGVLHDSPSFPYPVRVQGEALDAGETAMAQTDVIMPRFFETLGMRLLQGRDFSSRDSETAPRIVIINDVLARRFFVDQSPIGKRIGFGYGSKGNELEIVGVVNSAIHITPRDPNRMMFYIPYRQDLQHLSSMCLAVRTSGNPRALARMVREELRKVAPNLPVLRVNSIEDQLDDVLVQERLIATLSGFFGVLAALLASLGLYGVMSYTAARRTREIGVRLALGATRTGVQRMVLKESLLLVMAGVAIGVPVTLAAARLVSARLFGVSAADTLTIAGASVLMIAVAGLAGYLPARRASKVDPIVALRHE
jgi:predicted permease